MKTLKKLAICTPAFAVIMVALHHAIWYSYTLADYAYHMVIMCIGVGVIIVTVES
jgi:hypothetical protein